jgi:GNAT superfamily N-acetyltransferase
MTREIEIVALSPSHRDGLLSFFDSAFPDNPSWASCYCHCYYVDHTKVDWKSRTAVQNRSDTARLVECGGMHGLLAFDGGRVVGWCNSGPRIAYPALIGALDPHGDASETGVIMCFLVAPSSRGLGVATGLLDAACRRLAALGLSVAEAYPRTASTKGPENYHGPLSMYLQAGFKVDREDDAESVVVRKRLQDLARV